MKNNLVVIPTVNERDSLPMIIESVMKFENFHVLVVDDASTDGTPQIVREYELKTGRVFLLERPRKLGLGTAYVTGFRWGLERDYDYLIEMDADGSHNPDALPWFIKEMGNDEGLVIGSRYLKGTISVVGWDFKRLMLSKFGNLYASRILGLELTDLTSGFRCYSRAALEAIDLDSVRSNGYSFQIEMAYQVTMAGFPVREMPIIFYERNYGSSKMSGSIVREAVVLPWRLRTERIMEMIGNMVFGRKKNAKKISG
ncbi:MAG: polyprenol monophosphomannose synthase [Nitrospiraceae bacterium]|nr:polyprenol monophosphomannose synthase [Nitrospiraceae bacterium]